MSDNHRLPARYQNIQQIGSGAIGSVYKGIDAQSGKQIAIKYINKIDASYAESLENEFSILSTLTHPNLIRVYDYGRSEDGYPFFTMDYILGPNLQEYFKNRDNISNSTSIITSILSALEYLSKRNIVHGDIKPDNILISGGTEPIPVLVDFGLSTLSKMDHSKIFGTPRFIAPEIFETRKYSPKSDLYSLGHSVIESITNDPTPISTNMPEDYFSKVYDILNQTFSDTGISFSRTLSSFILELSNPDIDKRPDTIEIALHKLTLVTKTHTNDDILIEYSHVPRKHIDDDISAFLNDLSSTTDVLIIEGSIGTEKRSLLSNIISKAQLHDYNVLNFCAIQTEHLSLQDIVDILAINLSPDESANLTSQHQDLLANLKKAEASYDLDNLGVVYNNATEYVHKLANRNPVLLAIPNMEKLSSDFLNFLMHLTNRQESDIVIKTVISFTPDVPVSTEVNNIIQNLISRSKTIYLEGLNTDELKSLCRNIFSDDIFTPDELKRIISITSGFAQFIIDYLNFLAINKVIIKTGRKYSVDHKLLNKNYSNNKYDDIAEDILSRLNMKEKLFLTTLSLYNAPIKLSAIANILSINIVQVIEHCEQYRLLDLTEDTASLKSAFLKNVLIARTDKNTRRNIHKKLAEYIRINNPKDFYNIAKHYIKSGSVDDAYRYGMEAVNNLELTHEYYSAYSVLISLSSLIKDHADIDIQVSVLEKLAALELTLGYFEDSEKNYLYLIELNGDSDSTSTYYSKLGHIEHIYKGNQSGALEFYNVALEIAQKRDNREMESHILTSIGVASNDVSYIDRATTIAINTNTDIYIRALSKALYYHTVSGNKERCTEIIFVLNEHLSNADTTTAFDIYHSKYMNAFYFGDYQTADDMLQHLITLSNQSRDERAHIQYLSSLAGIHYIQGHFDEQIIVLRDALSIISKYQLYSRLIVISSNLALAYIAIGKYSDAIRIIHECAIKSDELYLTNFPTYFYSIGALAYLFFGTLYETEFKQYLLKLNSVAKETKNNISLGHLEIKNGDNYYFNLNNTKSVNHYLKALDIFQKANAKDDTLETCLKLSISHTALNANTTAREYAKQAAKIFREINCGYLKPLYSYVIALTEYHDDPDSLAPLLEAIETSKAFGTREWTWQIQFHVARYSKDAGDIANAVKYCREAINTLKEITESFDSEEQISSYLQVPLRSQVFEFVKELRS